MGSSSNLASSEDAPPSERGVWAPEPAAPHVVMWGGAETGSDDTEPVGEPAVVASIATGEEVITSAWASLMQLRLESAGNRLGWKCAKGDGAVFDAR